MAVSVTALAYLLGLLTGVLIVAELRVLAGLVFPDNGARPGDPSWGGA